MLTLNFNISTWRRGYLVDFSFFFLTRKNKRAQGNFLCTFCYNTWPITGQGVTIMKGKVLMTFELLALLGFSQKKTKIKL